MKKNAWLLLLSLVLALGFKSCDDDATEQTARVQLKLIDAEGDYEQVNVEIVDIQYNSSEDESGWQSFEPTDGYPIQTDLTQLIAGNELLLTDQLIPAGMLKQIRLVLSDNNTLKLEGQDDLLHLDTPSAQQSGLKIQLDQELEPGFSYTFILDWDVQKSVVEAGNSGKYNLKPVIRATAEVNSGSIYGTVMGDLLTDESLEPVVLEGVLVKVLDESGQPVTETLTNENGDFLLQGLDPGQYKLHIEENEFVPYESEEFLEVIAGEITQAGTIELQVPVN